MRARSRYGVHSPFVYEFVTQVLPHRKSEVGAKIEALRREVLADQNTVLRFPDFGAGYGGQAKPFLEKTLAQVAKSSARGRREGELLHRICMHYQPKVCLELGTNLGFSTMYQASALKDSLFVTVEGAPELMNLAMAHASMLRVPMKLNPEVGEFDEVLDRLLEKQGLRPNYVLMDGNHRYAPTMAYFHKLLLHLPDQSMVILDDINWSAEMRQAWKEIAAHPEVTVSIDLFFMGIAFIRRPQKKQHFRLRFFA
jgi:predicted O-methyltransferase YrrM